MRKSGYILSAAVTFILAVSPILPSTSFATTKVHVTQSKVNQALASYKAAEKKFQDTQKKIDATDAKIGNATHVLKDVLQKQDQTQKRLDQILVRLYMSGQSSLEKQLLSSRSFSEFLGRLEDIRLLMENDYQVIAQYEAQAKQIEQSHAAILKQVKANSILLAAQQKQMQQLETQYKALKEELRKERIAAASVGVSDPGTSSSSGGGYWLDRARAMMGKVQYKFGAESYPYFDCSGWTQYVFRTYRGINIPRTADEQSQIGLPVTRLNLQPGDLVFFQGTYKAGVSHVGIYLGNSYYINNLNEQVDLQIDSLNSSYSSEHYYGARRVN